MVRYEESHIKQKDMGLVQSAFTFKYPNVYAKYWVNTYASSHVKTDRIKCCNQARIKEALPTNLAGNPHLPCFVDASMMNTVLGK